MGLVMSYMGMGSSTQMLNVLIGRLYSQFVKENSNSFEDFHMCILDIFNNINASFPGKRYDVPRRDEVEECFKSWKEAKEVSERRNLFIEFMGKSVKLSKLDNYTMITGIVTPPAAMAAKRAGEKVPQLRLIKSIPDVVFVPSATVIALFTVKLSRRIFQGNVAS